MKTDLVIDKKRFEEDGFLLIKNVFTKEEVEEIRKIPEYGSLE